MIYTLNYRVQTYTPWFMMPTPMKWLVAISIIACMHSLQAQDVHFSHIHASPIVLNPSLTGLFDGDIRVIGNARQQWKSVPVNYQTAAVSVDMSMFDMGRSGFVSGAMQVYTDKAGDLDFSTTQANFSLAMAQPMDYFGDHYFSIGLQGGISNQSIDYTKVFAFDQEPLLATALSSLTYLDVSAGASWFYSPGPEYLAYLGAAVYHINRPNVAMIRQSPVPVDGLYRRIVIHGGFESKPRNNFHIMPSFIFMDQGPHQEINTGSYFKFDFDQGRAKKGQPALYLGAWVRWYLEFDGVSGVDAVIASARLNHGNVSYAFSYDINVSPLVLASNYRGGPEVSIIYIHKEKQTVRHKKRIRCPRF